MSDRKRGPYKKRTIEADVVVLPTLDQDDVAEINSKKSKVYDRDIESEEFDNAEASCGDCRISVDLEDLETNETTLTPDELGDSSPAVLDNDPSIVINKVTNVIYEQPNVGVENCHLDYLLSELQDEVVNIDDQEYVDGESAEVIGNPIAELISEEVIEIEKSENETEDDKDHGNDPIFMGSPRKLGFLVLFICCLSIRFKLPDEALNYIMILIGMVLPPGHNMIKSVYALREYLRQFVSFPKIHFLCSSCGTHVEKNDKTCRNKSCNKNLSEPAAIGYFIQHSIINQLQIMVQRSSFLQKIRSHKFEHYKANPDGNLQDIYDGYMYKKLFVDGFLQNPNAISFSMNTDGIPVFKSSKISMWPVYLLINELPISERKLKENVLYYGLWICSKKPVMWSYLKPLHEELSKLEDGIEMNDNNDQKFILNACLLNCVCDLPARCMMSNSMQFNGEYGCWFCYQPGQTFKTEKGGHTHIFPFQEENPKGPERTVESLEIDVNKVISNIQQKKKNYIVRGIKGPFWFMFLRNFDVIHGFVIDYMHGICSGVMKMLLTFWFDKKFHQESFSIFKKKDIVNSRLAGIKPNLHITRPPRSLDDLCHWKSSEFRNFLFLWGIPVLHGVLPHQYFMHFCLLVRGIFNLAGENIGSIETDNAEQCLFKFVELFTCFYPKQNLTMNCHQLLHITDSVRANGPLFANNCFIFEDLNGYILKHIHGPTGVETQVIHAVTMMQALPTLQELYVDDSEDSVLINSILRPNYLLQNIRIEDGIYLLGHTYHKTLDEEECSAVAEVLSLLHVSVTGYSKIFLTKLFCSVYGTAYGRLMKRNQSVVKFENQLGVEQLGSVKTFIQVKADSTNVVSSVAHNLALIYPFTCKLDLSSQQSSHEVTTQYVKMVAVPLGNILRVCNIIMSGDTTYVSEFPNRYEKD